MRSIRLILALVLLCAAPVCAAARPDKSAVFTFESIGTGGVLGEWYGGPASTLFLDSTVVHSGRYAARIERVPGSSGDFSALSVRLPMDFPGQQIELAGWLRLEDVSGFAGLWQRQDGPAGAVQFDNMQSRGLRGTRDWAEYRIVLPRDAKGRQVFVGALLAGTGRVWLDDVRVLVDGKPLAEAPVLERMQTVLDTDTTFAAGSGIEVSRLPAVQIANLALLGKVWGFLKYHHPAIVDGRRHWDFELFRVMPRVLAARDRRAACAAMADWVDSLGPAPACSSCAESPAGRPVVPRLGWIADRELLGERLASQLGAIHSRREKRSAQFFVSFTSQVGNPDFAAELAYDGLKDPDAGYRLLALFRFWNMVEYWFPYRDVIGEDWDAVLREFVPRLAGASGREAYATELMALIARVNDTHANLWSSLDLQPPRGSARLPVHLRFVEGRATVVRWADPRLGPASGLAIGDVVESVDGAAVGDLVKQWRPLYAASNEPTRLRDIARGLGRGAEGLARLGVVRGGRRFKVEVRRVPPDSLSFRGLRTHDHPGPAFRRLGGDIAYLRLEAARRDSVAGYFEAAKGAKLLVLDHRNYPTDFPLFEVGGRLVAEPTPFARFTLGDAANPGSFRFGPAIEIKPIAPRFEGAVAILVDEVTQSSAEYHSMAYRAAPKAIVVGSTTAGADGNVSRIALPGGLSTVFSGIGVFWPDGRPTQRVGIEPDLVATPTIAGLAAGRDEVLEAAVRRTLGREITPGEYEALRAGAPTAP